MSYYKRPHRLRSLVVKAGVRQPKDQVPTGRRGGGGGGGMREGRERERERVLFQTFSITGSARITIRTIFSSEEQANNPLHRERERERERLRFKTFGITGSVKIAIRTIFSSEEHANNSFSDNNNNKKVKAILLCRWIVPGGCLRSGLLQASSSTHPLPHVNMGLA